MMPKKSHHYLIILPIIIYIFFAFPGLKESLSDDSTLVLVAADEIFGSRQWPNFSYVQRASLYHPPLYLISLSLIRVLFGTKIIFLRLFSLVCGIFSVILVYLISRQISKDKKNHFVPLIACLIYSINPFVIKGSLHLDIDSTVLTVLILAFVLLFLRSTEQLNAKNMLKLSFVFGILLSAKLTTPFILAVVMLVYLLLNKQLSKGLHLAVVFISGFIIFFIFYLLYCAWLDLPWYVIFKMLGVYLTYSIGSTKLASSCLKSIYDILRVVLWFSPFFLLLWVWSVVDSRHEILRNKGLGSGSGLLIVVSAAIFFCYLIIAPLTHSFPKYLFPVVSMISILIANIAVKLKDQITGNLKILITVTGLLLIYNILFVGDLLYLTNYGIKERIISGNFSASVRQQETLKMLLKISLLLIPSLGIVIFLRKKMKFKLIHSVVFSFLIMFIASSLSLNIIQYKAKYNVVYAYGKQGTQEVIDFLKARLGGQDRVIAPYEIVYYLGATESGFAMSLAMLDTAQTFIDVLEDKDPACVVYGLASNSLKQYKDIFSSELLCAYFQEHHFKSKKIGSYTVWIRSDQ
ncbi:ArnT family glycosyltransferase [Candidatus Omnitrophota bacterium]